MIALWLWGCVPHYADLPPLGTSELATRWPMRQVEVDGVRIAYVDSGGDLPVLLFVHGLSSSLSFWDLQLDAFRDRYRVIALDLPGFGASDRPDAPYTPPWYADTVVSFLDALGIDRVTWVGHSMGGQIGLHAALRHGDRLDALVLAAPAGFERFTPGEARWMKTYWTDGRSLEADEPAIRANFTALVFNRHDALVEQWIAERVRLRDTDAFRGTSVAVARCVAGMLDHPVLDRLGEVATRTLIVYGTRDHLIPNPIFHGGRTRTIAEAGRDRLPNAELVLIPGAGHGVQHDAPDAFDAAVTAFLTRP
ncbi:MAG: alpha/beta hydrolase [Myxococcota bacterium]